MRTHEPLRVVSYGGGVQSTALLVLAAQRRIDYRTFLMANVGDDSENPETLVYVRDHAAPFAAAHGIDLRVIDKRLRDGSVETLLGRMTREGGRSLPIPARGENGRPMKRACTADFKIRVVGRWLKAHGASAPRPCRAHGGAAGVLHPECGKCEAGNLATVGIGISLDEIQRANTRKAMPYERLTYPLVGIGEETGLKLNRNDCGQIIRRAGLPIPPKSSCWFCPFHTARAWVELRRRRPDLFDESVALERLLNDRRTAEGKSRRVYLTRFGMPLDEVIGQPDDLLPIDDADETTGQCDSGWCWT